jgi:hypothetical protein
MSVSKLRFFLCWALALLFPLSLIAADAAPAILRSTGGVWVNGSEVSGTTSIFPGDLIETKPVAVANIEATGSTVLVQAESVIKFNGDSLTLEHGMVSVTTTTGFTVHVDCMHVEPVLHEWTQYDVTHVNENVQAFAHKLDVNLTQGASMRKTSSRNGATQSATVHEGQQASRNTSDACGVAAMPHGAAEVNTKWIEIGAAAGGGVLALCLLLCKGSSPKNMSDATP